MTVAPGRHVAVLGAGIMGCSIALFLARRGCTVTLVDRSRDAMNGASRWNEGKIHLGFLYAADPSARTARHVIQGGLAFNGLVRDLIGCSLADAATREDDIYLVHPESVVGADAMERYFKHVEALISNHEPNGYLAPISGVERLSPSVLRRLASREVGAGFRVPERSVNPLWVADRFVEAVAAEPNIIFAGGTNVNAVKAVSDSWSGPWRVQSDPDVDEQFDVVVNALWEGRLAIDRTLGLDPEPGWSHRFRLSLFAETRRTLDIPSMVLATGPFGDIKNYNGRQFYMSWYPAGLVAEGEDIAPPSLSKIPSDATVIERTKKGLTTLLPPVQSIFDHADSIRVAGGWVFALGKGSLADPKGSLHRRDRFGIRRMGNYYSVDTGKYSMAPWLARMLVHEILGD